MPQDDLGFKPKQSADDDLGFKPSVQAATPENGPSLIDRAASFLDKNVLDTMPGMGAARRGLSAISDYSHKQASEVESGQPRRLARYGYGVLGDTADLLRGSLGSKALATTVATSVAPEVMVPYMLYQGGKDVFSPRRDGETQADTLQRRLYGGSLVAGSGAVGAGAFQSGANQLNSVKAATRGLELAKKATGKFELAPTYNIPFTGGALKVRLKPEVAPEPTMQPLSESPYYPRHLAARSVARRQAMSELQPQPAPDPLTEAVRGGYAARLPVRIPKPRTSPFQEIGGQFTRSDVPPSSLLQLPPAANSALATTSPAKVEYVTGNLKPVKSSIVSPDSPPPVAPGSYWSFSEPALRKAAVTDRAAATVYVERFGSLDSIPNSSFLTDVGASPTRGLYRSRK